MFLDVIITFLFYLINFLGDGCYHIFGYLVFAYPHLLNHLCCHLFVNFFKQTRLCWAFAKIRKGFEFYTFWSLLLVLQVLLCSLFINSLYHSLGGCENGKCKHNFFFFFFLVGPCRRNFYSKLKKKSLPIVNSHKKVLGIEEFLVVSTPLSTSIRCSVQKESNVTIWSSSITLLNSNFLKFVFCIKGKTWSF